MTQVTMAAIPALKDSFAQLKTRMEKAVEDFRKEMASTRTGRASVHMLDSVTVEAYGSQMPLNQLANVSAPEPQLITVAGLGRQPDRGHREGHSQRRPRLKPDERRQAGPRAGAGAGPKNAAKTW